MSCTTESFCCTCTSPCSKQDTEDCALPACGLRVAAAQKLQGEKDRIERQINEAADAAARDLGLQLEKTIKLEWHKAANTRTRCLRITAKEEKGVRAKLQSAKCARGHGRAVCL